MFKWEHMNAHTPNKLDVCEPVAEGKKWDFYISNFDPCYYLFKN